MKHRRSRTARIHRLARKSFTVLPARSVNDPRRALDKKEARLREVADALNSDLRAGRFSIFLARRRIWKRRRLRQAFRQIGLMRESLTASAASA